MTHFNIREITFNEVLPVWRDNLWPGRESKIEGTSAIKYGAFPYEYDMEYMHSTFYGVGAYVDNVLVGVNAGHMTGDSFRSRGLYVNVVYRKQGISKALLTATIDKAISLNAKYVWTMPRRDSLSAYNAAGFEKTSNWFQTETAAANCFAICGLTHSTNFDSFSHGQIVSKLWLCEELEKFVPAGSNVTILGGWHNVLGFMLQVRRPEYYGVIQNVDVDCAAIRIANKVTNAWVITGQCNNIIGDANYTDTSGIVVNCSAEHFDNNDWFDKLANGTMVCIQATDVVSSEMPWVVKQPTPSMASFVAKYPVAELLYIGEKRIQYNNFGYDRYMLIGKK